MTFVSADTNKSTTASVVVTAPSGIQDGDILIASAGAYGTSVGAPAFPAGFSTPITWSPTSARRVGSAWKRASGESGNYTFTATSATQMVAGIMVFRGRLASGTPVGTASNGAYTTNDTIVRALALTAAAGDDLAWVGFEGSTGNSVTPALTSAGEQHASYVGFGQGYSQNVSAGSTGNVDGSLSSSNASKRGMMWNILAAEDSGGGGFFNTFMGRD